MNKRSIYGILVLAVGFIALAGSLGFVEIDRGLWTTFWPVILIAVGLVNLIEDPHNIVFAGIMTLLGTVFLLRNLGFEMFERFNFWEVFWPVIIIFVGLQLLTSKKIFSAHSNISSGDDLDVVRIFSGADVSIDSQDFTGGDIVTVFGGANVDLRGAGISNRPARMDIVCIFGGADVKVPEDWKVKVTGVPIFGGWGNKTTMKNQSDHPVDLEISCVTIFGGMDVKN